MTDRIDPHRELLLRAVDEDGKRASKMVMTLAVVSAFLHPELYPDAAAAVARTADETRMQIGVEAAAALAEVGDDPNLRKQIADQSAEMMVLLEIAEPLAVDELRYMWRQVNPSTNEGTAALYAWLGYLGGSVGGGMVGLLLGAIAGAAGSVAGLAFYPSFVTYLGGILGSRYGAGKAPLGRELREAKNYATFGAILFPWLGLGPAAGAYLGAQPNPAESHTEAVLRRSGISPKARRTYITMRDAAKKRPSGVKCARVTESNAKVAWELVGRGLGVYDRASHMLCVRAPALMHNPRTKDLGADYVVSYTATDAASFANRYPGSTVQGTGAFVFSKRTGDLVDTFGSAAISDGRDWHAFMEELKESGRRELAHQAANPSSVKQAHRYRMMYSPPGEELTIEVVTQDPKTKRLKKKKVTAYRVSEGLVIHPTMGALHRAKKKGKAPSGDWAITHLPTGQLVASVRTKDWANRLAHEIARFSGPGHASPDIATAQEAIGGPRMHNLKYIRHVARQSREPAKKRGRFPLYKDWLEHSHELDDNPGDDPDALKAKAAVSAAVGSIVGTVVGAVVGGVALGAVGAVGGAAAFGADAALGGALVGGIYGIPLGGYIGTIWGAVRQTGKAMRGDRDPVTGHVPKSTGTAQALAGVGSAFFGPIGAGVGAYVGA